MVLIKKRRRSAWCWNVSYLNERKWLRILLDFKKRMWKINKGRDIQRKEKERERKRERESILWQTSNQCNVYKKNKEIQIKLVPMWYEEKNKPNQLYEPLCDVNTLVCDCTYACNRVLQNACRVIYLACSNR